MFSNLIRNNVKKYRNISTLTSSNYYKINDIQDAKLITAIKTPYLNNGKIDLNSFDNHMEKQIKNGVDGFIIGGTTGEGHLLSWDEHIMLIAHAKNSFGDKSIIIGNTGSNSTKEANKATEQGFAVGMDASLQINPYYGKTSKDGLFKHFFSVLSHGPGIIYNVPSRTAQDLTFNTILELSKHPNFVGVKECTGHKRINNYSEHNIVTWSGNDDEFHESIHKHGCNGVISVGSNVVPGLFRYLVDNEDYNTASKLDKLNNMLFHHPNPIGINTLMMMLENCQPNFRLPYMQLEEDLRIELEDIVYDLGINYFISKNKKCHVMYDTDFNYLE